MWQVIAEWVHHHPFWVVVLAIIFYVLMLYGLARLFGNKYPVNTDWI